MTKYDDIDRAYTFGEWIAAVGIEPEYRISLRPDAEDGSSSVTEADEDDGLCSCGDYLDHLPLSAVERQQYEWLKGQRSMLVAQLREVRDAIRSLEERR